MRWIVLVATLLGIGWFGYSNYQEIQGMVLITEYWELDYSNNADLNSRWRLTDTGADTYQSYNFARAAGFWGIAKALWMILAFFALILLCLMPVSTYISERMSNTLIQKAVGSLNDAKKRANDAENKAKKAEREAKEWAEEKIKTAEEEQRKRLEKELEEEWMRIRKEKANVKERESVIGEKEANAQKIAQSAKAEVNAIRAQYNSEKTRFEYEMSKMEKAKENAQAGFKRLRKKITHKSGS